MISILKKPKNGCRIELTWLPKNNATPDKNCYIGSRGIVKDLDRDGFELDMGGAGLIVLSGIYFWRNIK